MKMMKIHIIKDIEFKNYPYGEKEFENSITFFIDNILVFTLAKELELFNLPT